MLSVEIGGRFSVCLHGVLYKISVDTISLMFGFQFKLGG